MKQGMASDPKRYRVNELFYSLQGEGRWAGRASIFVRFSGCNLHCSFCDTDFAAYREMTATEIVEALDEWKKGFECHEVVLTGGEPTLQVDESLTELLHDYGYHLSMETNGTRPIPAGIDWVTCSPKEDFIISPASKVVITEAQEVKVVFDGIHPVRDYGIKAQCYEVQPCDTGDATRNKAIMKMALDYVKKNPKWQLSLQLHKIIGIR